MPNLFSRGLKLIITLLYVTWKVFGYYRELFVKLVPSKSSKCQSIYWISVVFDWYKTQYFKCQKCA